MSAPRYRTAAWSAVIVLAVSLCAPEPARAQAFVPAKGEGAVSVLFQESAVTWHLMPTARFDLGRIKSVSGLVDFSVGLGRHVGLSVAVPYLALRYTGSAAHRVPAGAEQYHPTFVFQDDGTFHGGLQDLRVDLRYNVTQRGLVVTPFVAVMIPLREYEYFAHSAVGRNLREGQIGVVVAKLLHPWLPGAFVQSRYSYSLAESVIGIAPKRSNLGLEGGYFVTPRLRLFFLGTGQVTHGGIDIPPPPLPAILATLGPERLVHHDQIARYHEVNLGGGAAFDLTESVGIFGSVMKTVAGRNIHVLDHTLTVGLSWGFGRKTGSTGSIADAAASAKAERARAEADSLVKCVCMKN